MPYKVKLPVAVAVSTEIINRRRTHLSEFGFLGLMDFEIIVTCYE